MKYMLMMQGTAKDTEGFGSLTSEEIKEHIEYMGRLDQDLRDSGELVIDEGLAPPDQARIVTASEGGPPTVSDGPFPEGKEFLAGFWIVDVESPERAIEIAARASSAPGQGGIQLNIPIHVLPVGEPPTEA
ncbi:MAG TPA: YciI family protein [Actinomycetota bacterium]|nr:YciI family protein [Actinomycetota bacterium]